jgi:hypothetical protein
VGAVFPFLEVRVLTLENGDAGDGMDPVFLEAVGFGGIVFVHGLRVRPLSHGKTRRLVPGSK